MDFKSEQYRFNKATKEEKSELLKDILAFANAWRRSDAYIVIGVKELKSDKSEVIGINEDIDDAQLQQFVNSKVNTPIDFSYQTSLIDEKKVALITISLQSRPIYLKKDFGKLSANTVYLRRGSSTEKASPDEIAKMGASTVTSSNESPVISTFFVSGEHNELRSFEHEDSVKILKIPPLSDFPDYRSDDISENESAYAIFRAMYSRDNPNYFSELAKYRQQESRVSYLKFGVENLGNKVAKDLRVVIQLNELPKGTQLMSPHSLLKFPKQNDKDILIDHFNLQKRIYRMNISKTHKGFTVEISFGKVQAKDSSICNESLCIVAPGEIKTKIQVKVFSDDLPEPSTSELLINITAEHQNCEVSDFTSL